MDTVTGSQMAIAIAREGGVGIIHRNLDIQNQTKELIKVKKKENYLLAQRLAQAEKILKEQNH